MILSFFYSKTALLPINYGVKMFAVKMLVGKVLQRNHTCHVRGKCFSAGIEGTRAVRESKSAQDSTTRKSFPAQNNRFFLLRNTLKALEFVVKSSAFP